MSPVYESGPRGSAQVPKNVGSRHVQRVLVIIGRQHIEPRAGCRNSTEPDSTDQFERASTSAVQFEKLPSQHDRCGPHVCPVGKPLVLDEVFFANQIVSVRRLENAESMITDACVLNRSAKPTSKREHQRIPVENGGATYFGEIGVVEHSGNADGSS